MQTKKGYFILQKINTKILVLIFSLLLIAGTPLTAFADNMTIHYPSNGQSTIAQGRDFYVIGKFSNLGTIPDNALFKVTLTNSSGTVVRTVSTNIKNNTSGMAYNYGSLTNTNNVAISTIKSSLMPDLVHDPYVPGSFNNGSIKACYSDIYFTSLICGGPNGNLINMVDEHGQSYTMLPKGSYTIEATLKSASGTLLGSVSKPVTIGVNSDKVLARFSPAEHLNKVTTAALAASPQQLVYIDPFPGYWDTSLCIPEAVNSHYLLEIKPRWKQADAAEYAEGTAHFYIYNVKDGSATYNVEIGKILKERDITDPSVIQFKRYNIGEFSIGNVQGVFTDFTGGAGDMLDLTRVDKPTSNITGHNLLTLSYLNSSEMDTNLGNGVTTPANRTLYINGVVKPIYNNPSTITINSDNSFTIPKRISNVTVRCTDNNTGTMLKTENITVNLTRTFADNTSSTSLLEFKYNLEVPAAWSGKTVLVRVQGFDATSNQIPGAEESFLLTVN